MQMVPAQPPLPAIWNRLFQFTGSFTANLASGQITPRTSQCSGRLGAAATSFADSILTSGPNQLTEGVEASSSHFFRGAASTLADASAQTNRSFRRPTMPPII